MGNLASAGGLITIDAVEKSLNQALDWLSQDTNPKSNDIKKYSAILILREYTLKQPSMTFNKIFDKANSNLQQVFLAFR